MATAFFFIVAMGVIFPACVAVVNAFNAFVNFLSTVAGFNLMFDIFEVLDCCLPFSLIAVILQLAAAFSIIVSFVVSRKLVTVLMNLFSMGITS